MDLNNNWSIREREITIRRNILLKAAKRIKISPDERLWLLTHSVYNTTIGGDVFHEVVDEIPKNQWLDLKISIEKLNYEQRIIPVLTVPGLKGQIITDWNLRDIYGRVKPSRTPVKQIGVEINGQLEECHIKYKSDLGLCSVSYEYDCYDDRMKCLMPIYSSSGNSKHALKREPIDDHTIRYYCKSPISDSFDALVFTVSWALDEELNKCK